MMCLAAMTASAQTARQSSDSLYIRKYFTDCLINVVCKRIIVINKVNHKVPASLIAFITASALF